VEDATKRRKRRRIGGRGGKQFRFAAGTNLFDREHPAREVYLLQSGQVLLSRDQEAIIDCLGPGQFFGEQSLLIPRRRDHVARALTAAEVTAFRRSEILDRLQTDRRFALKLLKGLAGRMNRYEDVIRDFVVERAEVRLARFFRRSMPSRPASGWVRLPYAPSSRALAKIVGTTRWRVSVFMRHFEQMGWLRRQEGLWIHRQGLARFLESLKRG
jgi:CRP-like cAMP-binding protein